MAKIVHISHYPLAGAPYHTVKCLKKYSSAFDYELINGITQYADGRTFPHFLTAKDDNVVELIQSADIVHFHNMLPEWAACLVDKRRQKVVGHFHSFPKMYNWEDLIRFSDICVVLRQPFQIKEYSGMDFISLPNIVDIFELVPSPRRYDPRNGRIFVNYAPSNTKPSNWPDSKGYDKIMPTLRALDLPNIVVDHYLYQPHEADLRKKSEDHIVIDDLTKPTYHLTGLFGLSFGCAVLSGMPEKEFVSFYNSHFSKKTDTSPFLYTNTDGLYGTLKMLSENIDFLVSKMNGARKWMEEYYNPKEIVKEYEAIYYDLL